MGSSSSTDIGSTMKSASGEMDSRRRFAGLPSSPGSALDADGDSSISMDSLRGFFALPSSSLGVSEDTGEVSMASPRGSSCVALGLAADGPGVENKSRGWLGDGCLDVVAAAAETLNRGVEANCCSPAWRGLAFCFCCCACGAWRLEGRKRGCAGV